MFFSVDKTQELKLNIWLNPLFENIVKYKELWHYDSYIYKTSNLKYSWASFDDSRYITRTTEETANLGIVWM